MNHLAHGMANFTHNFDVLQGFKYVCTLYVFLCVYVSIRACSIICLGS